MKNIENGSPEIRAFIYQQLTDLETLLPQGTAVSVVVEDPALDMKDASEEKKMNSKKKVVMQLETSVGNLSVQSANKDVYKAISDAKEDLKSQLNTLQSFIASEERSDQIDDIIDHKYLH